MSIAEIFKRALVRRIAFVLVAAVLAWAGIGKAHAQDYSACYSNAYGEETAYTPKCPTRQVAYSEAIRACEANSGKECKIHSVWEPGKGVRARTLDNNWSTWRFWDEGCPAGTEWFDSLMQCDKPCSERNSDLGPENSRPMRYANSGDNQCIAECTYSIISNYTTRETAVSISGQQTKSGGTLHGGIWGYTGDRCPASTPPKTREDEKPKDECTPAVDGQTYCMRPNGDACATASSGRAICWKPGEQGKKTDGPVTQTSNYGNQTPEAPDGSSLKSTTKVTTTSNSNSSTTTINTYTTNNGSPAGTANQGTGTGADGKPTGGGTGTVGGGTGDGKDDENGSTGGGDCAAPPVSSGDALLSQIAFQAWSTRCAISDRNKQQDEQATELAGQDDGLGTVNEAGIYGEGSDITGQLNESLIGSGGGQCATGWVLMGEPIELPDGFWSLASWIGMLIVALAYLWAAVLLSEG